jgi:hypothetical protein
MKEQLSDAGEAGRTSSKQTAILFKVNNNYSHVTLFVAKQKVYEIDISNRFWQTHKFRLSFLLFISSLPTLRANIVAAHFPLLLRLCRQN